MSQNSTVICRRSAADIDGRRSLDDGWERRIVGPQCGDGVQQPTPMARQGDAKFFEVFASQIGQHFGGDAILAECRLVAVQIKRSQQRRYIHRLSPGQW